ncbi:MAG: hypothetical protein V5A62_14440 [Haloarculaceae archaeon]
MTDSTDQDSAEHVGPGTTLASLSRRALLGLVVALWSAGSISNDQAIRLCYGMQGYGRFGYGGVESEPGEE